MTDVLADAVVTVTLTVNGAAHNVRIEPRELLVSVLRDRLGLTGAHIGCDTTSCGACTVLLDGRSVKSCTVLAAQAQGHEITTIEGLASTGEMHPVQRAFRERARPAVRVLHSGHGDGDRVAARGEPAPDRGRRCGRRWKATSAGAPATTTSSGPRWRPRTPAKVTA